LQVVECVPNFSEGRRRWVVDRLAAAASGVEGVTLLDTQADPDHNRSVLTFVGPPARVLEAAMVCAREASGLIDMETHSGSHPRIGATDVVPFVPVSGTSLEECAALARALGRRIAEDLGIPVYLYGAAAARPGRRNLADIRRGQYEGLKKEISLPGRLPDFGPPRMHPTAGATVVGARMPMVAFNVFLRRADLGVARSIARRIRERGGGMLRGVQAIGLEVAGGEVQVSMNLLDTAGGTSIWGAFAAVSKLAKEAGVEVSRSELVGLVTAEAVAGSLAEALRCPGLGTGQILESRLVDLRSGEAG